jgi:predicted dienelactone hydrolase
MLLTLLLACTGPDDSDSTVPDAWSAPDEAGPWLVGTDELAITSSATGVPLAVQVWFPAASASEAVYSYDDIAEGTARAGGVPDCATPHPVVMFSHGNGGLRYQSYFLTEWLASHGYVVIAPDHTGNTVFDLDDIPRVEVALRRPVDIGDAFDAVAASDAYGSCVDPAAGFAIIGHSFGGWTSLATSGAHIDLATLDAICTGDGPDFLCGLQDAWRAANPGDESGDLSDPRVWAMVPLAPVARWSLGGGIPGITVPSLVIGGTTDELTTWDGEVHPIFDLLRAQPADLAGLVHAGHFTFTDFCVGSLNGCGPDDMPPDVAHAYVNTLATAFLDVARGEDRSAAFLPIDSADVTWETH